MLASPLDQRLSSSVIGGRTAAAFTKGLGLQTVGDLLSHYPRRYERHGELTALTDLAVDESVTIIAEVIAVTERSMRAKKGSILEVRITDGSGVLSLTFFNQAWRKQELRTGARGMFAGKVGEYRGARQLTHPDYQLFPSGEGITDDAAIDFATRPIPIYPATSTIASWQIQKAIEVVLDTLPPLADPVPELVRATRKLMSYSRAVDLIHRPVKDADWGSARATLRFQEAFVLQAALVQQRAFLRMERAVPREPIRGGLLERFDAATPFTLTGDQRWVGQEIAADLASDAPMNRLVQGEVGSGKTLVALRGMLAVADSGGQSALLAPTEVLAGQHLRSIVRTLGPDLAASVRPTLITGQMPVADRRKATLAAVSGQSRIVVGTHALMSDNVGFFDLGLVVVDEQHRFGVEQREALRRKGQPRSPAGGTAQDTAQGAVQGAAQGTERMPTPPHVLVLTATPIPRTVAMTVFGDLDVSTIAELPSGRIPIETHVVPLADKPGWSTRVWQRVAEEVAEGRQAFVVCPAIDAALGDDTGDDPGDDRPADDATPSASVAPPRANLTSVLEQVRADPLFAEARVEALHGRMPSDRKDAVMRSFAAGEIDVLVATTVIEVGVDVPNASAMVVLDADRFGVSQLHQLRGRVGRGSVPGICLLVTHAEAETLARERVDAVASTLDGFELAQKDLELRREGDVLGGTQSGGRSSLRLLRVVKDAKLIAEARDLASAVLEEDPALERHPLLRDALARRLDASATAYLSKN